MISMKHGIHQKGKKYLLVCLILICMVGLAYYFMSQNKGLVSNYSRNNAGSTTESDWETGDLEGEETVSLFFNDDYYSTTDQIASYLFIGTDASNENKDLKSKYRYTMADFLLLAVIDQTKQTYGFLQIDRNTMTEVDVLDENNESVGSATEQICTAHGYGTDSNEGCKNTVAAVEYLLGFMDIDGYYSINMDEIGSLNHLVGGVEVTLEDDFTNVDPDMKEGRTLLLSDEQAQHYVHDRMNVADGTNENRMNRQRQYFYGFLKKLKKQLGENPGKINDICDTFASEADTNLTERKISKILNLTYQDDDLGVFTLEGETKMGTTLDDGQVHEEFYPEEGSEIEIMSRLMNLSKDK